MKKSILILLVTTFDRILLRLVNFKTMKSIKLLFVILITSFLGFSQTQNSYRIMDWQLKDKEINISEAKKEGFAISFRNSDTFTCPYEVDFKKMRVAWNEDIGNNDEKLYYFFNFEEKTVSVYNDYGDKNFYDIKRIRRKRDEVRIKINSNKEKVLISVNLKNGEFKEVIYDKNKNISYITVHGKVYLYPRN